MTVATLARVCDHSSTPQLLKNTSDFLEASPHPCPHPPYPTHLLLFAQQRYKHRSYEYYCLP